MTLIDKDLVKYQLISIYTRLERFSVQTSLSKKFSKAKQQYTILFSISTSYIDKSAKSKYTISIYISADNKHARPKLPRKKKFLKYFTNQNNKLYYNFISLDQTESVVIVCNNKNRNFVAIKYAKKSSINNIFRISDFVNNYVVNIKNIFLNKKKIIIVYKQIDIFLKYIIAVIGNSLQTFKIATVYKEISLSSNNILNTN